MNCNALRRAAAPVLASIGALLLVTLSGCGAPPGGAPPAGSTPDCELGGYACTLGAVSDAVFARGDALMLELASRLRNGASLDALAQAARSQPDVVEARVDQQGASMYFLIEGGTPRFVHDLEGAASRASTNGSAPMKYGPASPAPPPELVSPVAVSPEAVVGAGTPRDHHDGSQRKSALVLAPYDWQFEANDSAPAIAQGLDQTYDYGAAWSEGGGQAGQGVRYAANTAETDDNITIADFLGWRDYDLIFVSTHGTSVGCDGSFFHVCRSAIFVGLTPLPCQHWRTAYPRTDGIECGVTEFETDAGDPLFEVGLSSDFFLDRYGGRAPLQRSVVVLDGCETLQNTTLAAPLAGQSSTYFGWTASVFASDSKGTTTALFHDLLRGDTTATAYADLKRAGLTTRSPTEGGAAPEFRRFAPHDQELRIIDLPALKDATGETRLAEGATASVVGIPEDGKNDQYDFVVDVTGIIDPNDTGSANVPQAADAASLYDLHFLVDGAEVGVENLGRPTPERTTVTRLDDTTYRMRYPVMLPFDVPEGGRDTRLEVRVTLPEGGTSSHAVDVTLRGTPCDYDLTLSGGLSGVSQGPASFTPGSDGSLEIDLNGSSSEGSTGDPLQAGVRIPSWDGSPGTYTVPDASASSADGSAIYLAGSDFDCASCGGTLTIDEVTATGLGGSFTVTMPTLVGPQDSPPPTIATATFHAVLQTSGDPFAPYGACADAWAAR